MRRLAWVLATLCVVHGAARADDWSLHILGTAQIGFTDNLLSAPRTPPPNFPPAMPPPAVESDLFLGIRPGILATYGTPRAIHEFEYTLDAMVYVRHSDLATLFNRAGYRGFFTTGPRSELVTSIAASFGNSNLFPTTASASAGQVGAQRNGTTESIGAEAGEDFTYTLSPDWRLTQGLTARFDRANTSGSTVAASRASELGARLSLEKSFRYDAVIFTAGTSYLALERPNAIDPTAPSVSDNQINARGTLGWHRDLTRLWSLSLEGGGVAVIPRGGMGKSQLVPVVAGSLAYYPAWGSASFSARREIAPNLLIAQNTLTDSAVATAWLPLPWRREDPTNPELSFQATLGVARVRLINTTDGTVVSAFDDLIGDMAVNWNFRKSAGLSFRYQVIWQSSDLDVTMGNPIYGFVRNTVLVQFFGRWPERLAVEMPIRQTLRVDRSNTTPVGDELQNRGGSNR